jgi:hypothetical protein
MEIKNYNFKNYNLINRPKFMSNSKEKNKNELALSTISNELNKIKNISKVNYTSNHPLLHLNPTNKSSAQNIFNNNIKENKDLPQKKISHTLFNNISLYDGLSNKIKKTKIKKMTVSNSLKLFKNNSKTNIFNNLHSQPNIHLRTKSVSHSPHNEKKLHSSLSNNNFNNNTLIPKSNIDRINFNKMKKENENYKKEIQNLNDKIKIQNEKIKTLENNLEISYKNNNNIKARLFKLKDQNTNILNENKNLKKANIQFQKEIKIMQEKELKLMKVLYLIKERGINIEDILNEVIDMNSEGNLMTTNRSDYSNFTVYFNDKIKMNDIMESKEAKKIPLMDFSKVPTYRPDSDSEEEENEDYENNNHIFNIQEGMKFNKINFTNEEQFYNNSN